MISPPLSETNNLLCSNYNMVKITTEMTSSSFPRPWSLALQCQFLKKIPVWHDSSKKSFRKIRKTSLNLYFHLYKAYLFFFYWKEMMGKTKEFLIHWKVSSPLYLILASGLSERMPWSCLIKQNLLLENAHRQLN